MCASSKPWDKLRAPVVQPKLGNGVVILSGSARVAVSDMGTFDGCRLSITTSNHFNKAALRDLAEMCTELANQS